MCDGLGIGAGVGTGALEVLGSAVHVCDGLGIGAGVGTGALEVLGSAVPVMDSASARDWRVGGTGVGGVRDGLGVGAGVGIGALAVLGSAVPFVPVAQRRQRRRRALLRSEDNEVERNPFVRLVRHQGSRRHPRGPRSRRGLDEKLPL